MPEKQYFKGIDVKSGSTVITSVDVKDSEARADLADLEDYVEGIAPVALSVTENGTYTAPTGVFGYSPVSVNVGGFTRTVLYDSGAYNAPAPYQTDVNLSDNLSNYDIIAIVTGTQSDNVAQAGYRYISEIFDVPMIQASKTVFMQSIGMRFCEISFTDTTFNIIINGGESSGYELQVYKIIGYKFG